jgi:nucleotide-binding universal stress UspA family protein
VAFGGADFTIVVGFDGTPRAQDALALGERRCRWDSRAVPALSVENGLLAAAAAERAVAIVVGSSRLRRGRRTPAERLVRSSAACAVTTAPLGFRARVAGLLDAQVASR